MRYHLATLGKTKGFFSEVIESGSHMQSIQKVISGQADSAAIDHTLFEYWAKQNPEQANSLRVITRLGPFPMPPLVISEKIPKSIQDNIQKALARDAPRIAKRV